VNEQFASKRKRFVFWLVLVVSTWLVVEGISVAAYSFINRALFSPRTALSAIDISTPAQTKVPQSSVHKDLVWDGYVEVLHPYFGFVADPIKNRPIWAVSEFGFPFKSGESLITKRSQDRILVAVFGGSFASGTYALLKRLFESRASELGKTVQVLNFSSAGYKQPQQLFVLNYLMALGAEFNIVVNIDGFNEVTLPTAENIPSGVNPYFPRGWDRRTAGIISQARLRSIGQIEFLRGRRTRWSQSFITHGLYYSPTLFLLWQYRDRLLSRAIYTTERELIADDDTSKSYATHGPRYVSDSDDELFHDLAKVWKNASRQMNAVCAANGVRYYHFLQPNQYVADSKPMTADEQQTAVTNNHPYERGVAKGYPVLAKAGEELKRSGVDFTDLTNVFVNEKAPVYRDDCCHLNETGYKILAARIYDEIYKK
jgi:hypothetical protein